MEPDSIIALQKIVTPEMVEILKDETAYENFKQITGIQNSCWDNLVRLYADEGISGTKIRNRKEFFCMNSKDGLARLSYYFNARENNAGWRITF